MFCISLKFMYNMQLCLQHWIIIYSEQSTTATAIGTDYVVEKIDKSVCVVPNSFVLVTV